MMKAFLIVIIFLTVTISSYAQKNHALDSNQAAVKEVRIPVPLFGLTWDNYGITIIVQSNGNTKKDDFRVEKHFLGDITSMTFIKIHQDHDKETPFKIWITFKPEELGLKPNEKIIITNQFSEQYVR